MAQVALQALRAVQSLQQPELADSMDIVPGGLRISRPPPLRAPLQLRGKKGGYLRCIQQALDVLAQLQIDEGCINVTVFGAVMSSPW